MGAVKGSHDSRSYPCKRLRQSVSTIAKSVFQVHAVDAAGKVIIRRQLQRRYVLALFDGRAG